MVSTPAQADHLISYLRRVGNGLVFFSALLTYQQYSKISPLDEGVQYLNISKNRRIFIEPASFTIDCIFFSFPTY
jgi:hypothetical protein